MENVELEVGMKVRVRDDIKDDEFGIVNASKYAGRVMTISEIFHDGTFCLEEDDGEWYWKAYLFSEFGVDDDNIIPPLS